jgi:hypothetical protein
MKLKWWHRELIRDLVVGMSEVQMVRKWKKWKLTLNKLRNYQNDPDFIAECTAFRAKLDDMAAESLLTGKLRAKIMVGGKALDVIDRVLSREPFDPATNEGDLQYNEALALKAATDMMKEMQLGKTDEEKAQKIEITFTVEKDEEKE